MQISPHAAVTSSTTASASSPPDDASTDEEDAADALALRRLHSLFEEERFTDAGADEVAVSLGGGGSTFSSPSASGRGWPHGSASSPLPLIPTSAARQST